ncbi:MAG: Hsp33 family molecular chaperone HslO [Lachnospiraceae bacterium]|nr:Hsp33 family molecular chaperone HslO [Lachnospiraceae bacterium]
MSDYIVRATAANAYIRIFAADTKELVETARQAHNTSPVMTAALGRLLTAGAMMGVMQKGDADILTLQIKSGGPAKGLTVTADSHGRVKGYPVVADVMLPPNSVGKLDVGGALAPGFLTVIKDLGLKEPYVGETMLVTGEIGDDLTEYFMSSEQVPSSVGLGVLMNKDNTVKCAGGFIVQLMPFAPDEVVDRLEANLKVITSVTALLDSGMTPEDIVKKVLDGFDIEFNDTIPATFYCNCSKDRFAKGLISLSADDMKEMIDSGETIEVNCRFCGKHYYFTTEELQEIDKLRQ